MEAPLTSPTRRTQMPVYASANLPLPLAPLTVNSATTSSALLPSQAHLQTDAQSNAPTQAAACPQRPSSGHQMHPESSNIVVGAWQHEPSPSEHDTASPFVKDFNLVAEAAKRAQLACLTRDLEGVGL